MCKYVWKYERKHTYTIMYARVCNYVCKGIQLCMQGYAILYPCAYVVCRKVWKLKCTSLCCERRYASWKPLGTYLSLSGYLSWLSHLIIFIIIASNATFLVYEIFLFKTSFGFTSFSRGLHHFLGDNFVNLSTCNQRPRDIFQNAEFVLYTYSVMFYYLI